MIDTAALAASLLKWDTGEPLVVGRIKEEIDAAIRPLLARIDELEKQVWDLEGELQVLAMMGGSV